MNTDLKTLERQPSMMDRQKECLQWLLDPTSATVNTIATPAQKLLCVLGDWTNVDAAEIKPVSIRAWMLCGHGYKFFGKVFKEEEHAMMTIRAATDTVVELQTIISYPDSRGSGSLMMEKLCSIADDLRVDIWLDAVPFGSDRCHIPLKKLKSFYRRFGFASMNAPRPEWLCGYHEWDRCRFSNVMFRRSCGG